MVVGGTWVVDVCGVDIGALMLGRWLGVIESGTDVDICADRDVWDAVVCGRRDADADGGDGGGWQQSTKLNLSFARRSPNFHESGMSEFH